MEVMDPQGQQRAASVLCPQGKVSRDTTEDL